MVKIRIQKQGGYHRLTISILIVATLIGVIIFWVVRKLDMVLESCSDTSNVVQVPNEHVLCETLRMTYTRIATPMVEYYKKICPNIYCEPTFGEHLFCNVDGSEGFHRLFECKMVD